MDGVKPKPSLIHFIGIGGIGMSALARWFAAHGYKISGSDIASSSTTHELRGEGVRIKIGKHIAENLNAKTTRVIYNQAIAQENPELQKAHELKIPTSSYPEVIGELTKLHKTIAIAGAHGKSTTTSMVALILEKAKFDPTVIVGTKLKEFGNKNFRSGGSDYLVLEADEWKGSFLNYFPYAALVTNIDREHLDHYKNLANVKKAFIRFLENVHPYGLIVLNRDDKNLFSIRDKIKKPVVWYSLKSKEAAAIAKVLKVSGSHNLSDATGAYTLARALAVKKPIILKVLGNYHGTWRRSEYRGELFGAKLFDDYGHHPTEIKVTLAGFREKYPIANLICVFQPHQRERLKLLFKDFTMAFGSADELILLEVYGVAGRDASNGSPNSKHLSAAIQARTGKSVPVAYGLTDLKKAIKGNLSTSAQNIIIMMGAGNINEFTDKLVARI